MLSNYSCASPPVYLLLKSPFFSSFRTNQSFDKKKLTLLKRKLYMILQIYDCLMTYIENNLSWRGWIFG